MVEREYFPDIEREHERIPSGGGGKQLPKLTVDEFSELSYIHHNRYIGDDKAARSIAAKLSDPRCFVVKNNDVVVDWNYVLDHLKELFAT